MSNRAPVIYQTSIQPEWLDYNDHMNVAYYVLIFDHAGEEVVKSLGLGAEVSQETGISWMVLENHITYNNEVVLDQPVEVRMQLLDHDSKRLHFYFEMYAKNEDGSEYLASTLEQMAMCVDLNARKSSVFPEAIMANIERLAAEQQDLPRPENIGRTIGIRRK
ncbi:thioesterase family protein [Oceanospirillum sediminis]|uniref:Thioesterase family protein n=1 Tax=Oceanospirillum sediminis TaxID=2760088 RepID=A0A839IMU8_9GAMM|nr:thioesterase family protein [Oceanospirillum sediminis]MBB1486030.1 thioesterase family protein [Oceanospirillum sediminis]